MVRKVGRPVEIFTHEELKRRRKICMRKYRQKVKNKNNANKCYKQFLKNWCAEVIDKIPNGEISFFKFAERVKLAYDLNIDNKDTIEDMVKHHYGI